MNMDRIDAAGFSRIRCFGVELRDVKYISGLETFCLYVGGNFAGAWPTGTNPLEAYCEYLTAQTARKLELAQANSLKDLRAQCEVLWWAEIEQARLDHNAMVEASEIW